MKQAILLISLLLTLFFFLSCENPKQVAESQQDSIIAIQETQKWAILPFTKVDSANPILLAEKNTSFFCPVSKKEVFWEANDVYNPSTVVRNGKIYMIYRAEDTVKAVNGTSRLGLAESEDGIHFKRLPQPVFFPDNDEMKKYEWMGGCEDPRIVEDSSGTYFMTYTAYDGKVARLCVASSKDLLQWKKHGLAFKNPKNRDMWSKSGAIVCALTQDGKMIATKIKGKYVMYWGENGLIAFSNDLITWEFLADEKDEPISILPKREGQDIFDNALVEPGPPALLTEKGILLIYNGASKDKTTGGISNYCGGQALFDKNDPTKLISRLNMPFIQPEKDYELTGLVNKVTFVEGLSYFKNQWFLYYGTADSRIAVAVANKK
ncbi:MAG: glycoside hydrolase family 130 protein [Thermoflexibacter sp.]